MAISPPPPILTLSNELLREILDHIEADPEKLVAPERRAYLSQESFRLPPPPQLNHDRDISNFRLVCKRFAKLGAIHQFAQVTTRFSDRGLERLEYIASQRHLAHHVRKFAYMVPLFYVEGRNRIRDVLAQTGGALGSLDARSFILKASEQERIKSSERDLAALKRALSAFGSLQHVQVLRVVDRDDSALLEYLRTNDALQRSVDLRWSPALTHSLQTLGAAIAATKSPCTRFSSPMMSSQSISYLLQRSDLRIFRTLAAQITSLELHFDDPVDLDAKMRELSSSFEALFKHADNMSAIHLGFPSHRPLTLPLEDIFHHVRWPKLVAFGIQGWKLDADEIICLAQRYQDRLRGLRLRDILLKEGSRWKTVLAFLRDDMSRLSWVSLRRIGYAKGFDAVWANNGVEVPDDPPGGDSESDSVGSEDVPTAMDGAIDSDEDTNSSLTSADMDEDDDSSSIAPSEDDDEDPDRGPNAHEMEFPRLSPDRPDPELWCTCGRDGGHHDQAPEEIGDDGLFVTNAQRKSWEKWVVKRCPQHSKPPR